MHLIGSSSLLPQVGQVIPVEQLPVRIEAANRKAAIAA
jgi:hypothetical protein